jgi:O-antigen/teichoic acid export membrane protein
VPRALAGVRRDSLVGNSAFLFINTALLAGFGFVFWSISAHVYTPAQVGVATALIAALNMIISLALLGLEISLIRFLPQTERRTELINASLTWTAALALACGGIFIAVQPIVAPRLGLIRETPLVLVLYLLFCIPAAWSYIFESIFVAHRSARQVVVKNLISSIAKLPLIAAFVFAGAFGIYSAWMASFVVGAVFAAVVLRRRFNHRMAFATRLVPVQGMTAFSFANYLATFAEGVPDMVLPIVVLDLLGAVAAAHYYIAVMLASLLFAVSAAAGQSLFAEGSNAVAELRQHARKAGLFMVCLLVPGIGLTVGIGPYVLEIFGHSYATSASGLLTILALSAVVVAANDALRAVHKVRMRNAVMFAASGLGSAAAVGLAVPLSADHLPGIGLAWCGGQVVTLILLAAPLLAPGIFSRFRSRSATAPARPGSRAAASRPDPAETASRT